jgi:pseudaminic acid cytidylyltransferase
MNIVAIIPARGGSKRIARKNIRQFAGKPIIAYSILAAKASGLFNRIIVSTDSDDIARTAKIYGAEMPFKRPAELSDDFTETAPVILHALNWLTENGIAPEYFCCIYATSPFLTTEYLKKGLDLLIEKDATTSFGVTSFSYPIFRGLKIEDSGRIKMLWPEYEHSRSNDLPRVYHDAGQFYWGVTKKFLKEQKLFSSDSIPVVLPGYLVQDIDTPDDWQQAERMYLAMQNP